MDINNKKIKFSALLKKDLEKRQEIIKLQNMFEEGKIQEADLTPEQRRNLERLYDEQIIELDNEITLKKKVLNEKINIVNGYYKKLIDLKTSNKK